ncbi:MAG: Maf family protein [bacterium]|nr:Maf family protein [bacterium]
MASTALKRSRLRPLNLVLASSSPRRQALLAALRIPFSTFTTPYHEPHHPHLPPHSLARLHARSKASLAFALGARGVILAADTVVALGRQTFGKPRSLSHAYQILRSLQGRTHRVYTAVTLLDTCTQRRRSACVCTKVSMRPLSRHEIVRYCQLVNPLDKAGAYAIQDAGSIIIDRIEGCYYNVMGLPIATVVKLLRSLGYSLFFPTGSPSRPTQPSQ